ncbi:glycosyltransferase family 4 protein [Algoriphagus halophytocola]|uniref:Glycosyltransferase family 4 protein n=1 Tax=Algoriphagus halophytocola TaxID=2991499 RepID=A0ABY6MJ46_9BACT|nr:MULTISPECIES: glycosyltransferase family 4 protein [unclassified Algoriphagus]UZD23050.1 glycosyltransferase family 4 protein [Algoriphagus sp. TR-M5]WBL44342.1 glycosyltransferase family 4 protein [Algoriphagus sp. TR-M9]
MKILWVNPSFLDYRVPLYHELNECLSGDFHVLFSKNRIPERVIRKVESALGGNSHGMEGERYLNLGRQGEFSNQGVQIPFQQGLLKAIRDIRPDIIIGEGFFQWTPLVAFYARKNKIPFWLAYERTHHTERNCPFWRKKYRSLISYFVNGYLANGSLTTKYLKEDIKTGDKPIIEGCMSADSSNLASRIQKLDSHATKLEKAGLNFLFVGQFIHRKGILELCEAWVSHSKIHPEDTLTLIGDGELKIQVENNYSLVESIKIVGPVDYDIIHNFYAAADVFVMPTLEDNWSLVVPEAMACGLPVATTIYNGCYPELVKDGVNGKVFDVLKKHSILNMLDYFHAQDLEKMGNESRAMEAEYSPSKVALRITQGILTNSSQSKYQE